MDILPQYGKYNGKHDNIKLYHPLNTNNNQYLMDDNYWLCLNCLIFMFLKIKN